MKKFPLKSLITASAIALMFSISSCNSCQTAPGTSSKNEIKQEVEEVVYPLPTAFEVTEMLNRIGASYIFTITNPSSNANRYLTEKSQALNLGVLGADLSYVSTYNQGQEVINYMSASKILIDELNMSAALDPEIIEKLEQNGDNKEELVKIITDSFYSTYKYLQKNERGGLSTIIIAGTWIEGLYIAGHISDDSFNNKEIVKIILDQKNSLDKLYEIMEKDLTNPDVKSIYDELMPVKNIYDGIDSKAITEEQLNAISNAIKEIRDKIVA